MQFITRKGATDKLKGRLLHFVDFHRGELFEEHSAAETKRLILAEDWSRARNYELEQQLEDSFGGEWCITEWCPFNGRFCKVAGFIAPPHPPLRGATPAPPETDIPWRNFDGRLASVYHRTDG